MASSFPVVDHAAIQAVPKLAQTDFALEQLGISQADIIRINADVERAAGLADLTEFEDEYGIAEAEVVG